MASHYFRSLWISDTHLGTKNLQNRYLLDFLQSTSSEYLYLVGDILDLWKLKKWHWPSINNQIVQTVFDKAKNGTKVIYLPGNHDDLLRNYDGSSFQGVVIRNEIIHTTANGGRYLVQHGDKLDCVLQDSKWLARLGSFLYEISLITNRWYNTCRLQAGKEYYPLSASLKQIVKTAVNYIGNFEEVIMGEVEKHQVDGLICGHIHHAAVKTIGNCLYTNAGDWVESCTALAENRDGTLGVIQWAESKPVLEWSENESENLYSNRCLASTN